MHCTGHLLQSHNYCVSQLQSHNCCVSQLDSLQVSWQPDAAPLALLAPLRPRLALLLSPTSGPYLPKCCVFTCRSETLRPPVPTSRWRSAYMTTSPPPALASRAHTAASGPAFARALLLRPRQRSRSPGRGPPALQLATMRPRSAVADLTTVPLALTPAPGPNADGHDPSLGPTRTPTPPLPLATPTSAPGLRTSAPAAGPGS